MIENNLDAGLEWAELEINRMALLLKAIFLGIVQGITEWLPVSSTGHMILVNEFLNFDVSPEFFNLFLVFVQLGSIVAVLVLYWNTLLPFKVKGGFAWKKNTLSMWLKIIVACVPSAIVGLLFEEQFTALFYNYQTVAIMLIVVGIAFIVVERSQRNKRPRIGSIDDISYRDAFIIGLFQMVAAVLPGTSRSGATIIGALLLSISRPCAAEFTFFLAIPTMFGASLLKLIKHGLSFTSYEVVLLLAGMITAFIVSIFCIRFLMRYIQKHDFTVFGYYRIILGCAVLAYFFVTKHTLA